MATESHENATGEPRLRHGVATTRKKFKGIFVSIYLRESVLLIKIFMFFKNDKVEN